MGVNERVPKAAASQRKDLNLGHKTGPVSQNFTHQSRRRSGGRDPGRVEKWQKTTAGRKRDGPFLLFL